MPTFADHAIAYYNALTAPTNLPPGIGVMNPYEKPDVQRIVGEFYAKFYNDTNPRVFVLGINPGRFGAGVTGISFTTPQNLRRYCGIANNLHDTGTAGAPVRPRPELSSRFIYQVVEAFGGAQAFYGQFFLTSLFPLALTKDGRSAGPVNYNYYDDRVTTDALWPAITQTVRTQLTFGGNGEPANRRVAVCLGRKNETYLHRLNEQQGFFDRIVTLDHPRYILQYKSKDTAQYLDRYIATLHECSEQT